MTAANTAVELELETPERRNRVTVFFRGLLVIPQTVACLALNIAFFFVMFVGWFAALATARLPNWAWTFSAHVVAYEARVQAYRSLLVDQYPPFAFTSPAATNYPVQLDMPEQGQLSRVKIFFRSFMFIPASFVILALNWGWIVCGFFVWLSVLATGRTPQPVFDTLSANLRYMTRTSAWYAMLTDKYPTELFGDNNPDAVEQPSAARPLVLSTGGKRLVITFIVAGVLGYIGYMIAYEVIMLHYMMPMLLQRMQHMPHH